VNGKILILIRADEISDEVKEVNKGMKRALHQRENHHRENMIRAFNEEQQKCHQALKTSTYEQYKNINPDRIEGTCQWILENPQYGNWRKSGHNDLLWISADPGCGKSVLSKSLVDIDLKKSTSASVCYFFFKDNEDQNSLATALCAVLHQLFGMQPDLLRHAIPEWKKNGQKIRQEVYELWRILEAAISDPAFSSTICIFDGLDECQSSDQAQLIEKLTVFYTESDSRTRQSWFKFLVTSRPYIEIQDRFRSTTQSFPQIHIRGEEENDQIHEEINLIVKKRVKELGESEGLALETLQRLERQLLQMEHRTYLWLHLAMDDIRNMFRLSFRPEEEMIQLIPTSVSAAYEKILNRVPKDKKKDVRIIFQIIVGARRPLTIEELAMALGIATSSGSQSPTESGLNPEGLDEKIRQLCGLFVFVNTSRKVFLIHQTATEFLVHNLMLSHEQKLLTDITVASHQKYREGFSFRKVCGRSRKWYHTTEAEANLCILKVCLAYLSAGELGSGSLVVRRQSDTGWLLRRTFENLKEYIPQHSFLEYSFVQWENHAIESHSAMLDDLGRLFTKAEIAPDLRDFWLLLMAKEGHKEVAKLLLNNGADVNTKFWSGCTALWSAISSRQEAMVKLLVEMGADINARDEGGQTPLWRAISSRQEVIVKLLVEMGADINARDENGRTPLWSAISNRQEAVAKLLVEMGAVVDTENSNGQTPLWLAISNNHGAIIELLVKKGADINIKDKAGWTPLRWAINTRRGAMVKQLVKMGANINSQGEFGWTPLKWAIRNKQDDMVKLLLEMGAVEAEDKSGQYDATLAATKKAHRAMIVTRR
jgi:ankyrin repeat protein